MHFLEVRILAAIFVSIFETVEMDLLQREMVSSLSERKSNKYDK